MPLFFFVSGIVVAHALREEWMVFLRRRLLQLAWIYVLWTSLYVIAGRQPPIEIGYAAAGSKIHLWFIWALLLYRAGAKALDRWRHITLAVLGVISLVEYFDLFPSLTHGLSRHHNEVPKYAVFFFYAVWFGRPLLDWARERYGVAVAGALPLTILSGIFDFTLGLSVFGVLAGLGLATTISNHASALASLFIYIGRRSLEIFVLHWGSAKPLLYVLKITLHSNFLIVPLATVMLVIISIQSRRISDRFAPWLFRLPHPVDAMIGRFSLLPAKAGDGYASRDRSTQ